MKHGPAPGDLDVCHTCDNRGCVNPDHLFLGTRADNMADCKRKGRNWLPRGDFHPQRKLSGADVRVIRALLTKGMTNAAVAHRYGVSIGAIAAIRTGKSWAHLD
jgi:hypothetical protein